MLWYSYILQDTAWSIVACTSELHIFCLNRWEKEGFWCLWVVLSSMLARVHKCSTFDGRPWPICLFTHRDSVPLGSPGQKTVTLPKMYNKPLLPIFASPITWISEDQFRNWSLASKIVCEICGCCEVFSNPVGITVCLVRISKCPRSRKSWRIKI